MPLIFVKRLLFNYLTKINPYHSRDGTIEEAEDDAIELRQFLYEKDQLYNIMKKGKLHLKFEKFKSRKGIPPKGTLNTSVEEKI